MSGCGICGGPVAHPSHRECAVYVLRSLTPDAADGDDHPDDECPNFNDRPECDVENVPNPRSQLLADAEQLVNGDRNNQYGPPSQDFTRTAQMWAAYLGQPVAAHDVAALMSLLKISRIRWSPEKADSWKDLAGYAACGWDCVVAEPENVEEPT